MGWCLLSDTEHDASSHMISCREKKAVRPKKGRASRREAIFSKKEAMELFHRNDAFVPQKDLFWRENPMK